MTLLEQLEQHDTAAQEIMSWPYIFWCQDEQAGAGWFVPERCNRLDPRHENCNDMTVDEDEVIAALARERELITERFS